MDQTAQESEEGVIVLDDAWWEELMAVTDGAAAPCFQCGVCTATCPWNLVRDRFGSVRHFMRQAQLGLQNGDEDLWLCTACAQCEALCPRGVPIAEVFRGLRYTAWTRRTTPAGLPSLLWSVYWNNNPWTQPPSQRSQWAKNISLPDFDPDEHEILFYVGCTSSYDRRAQKVTLALVQLFEAAGVPYGCLGDDEPCCGEPALSVGHRPYFEEVAQQAADVFGERGVTDLVTVSPHCYDTFSSEYQGAHQGFRPSHYTQFLAELVQDGRLAFESPVDLKVTFHDPCYLARRHNETEAPRCVLDAVPGVQRVEMERTRMDTLCCGGGGGQMWLETAPGERLSDLRTQEAVATGANVLATACPFCIACLEDSVKAQGIQDLVVMDVAELAALGLGD